MLRSSASSRSDTTACPDALRLKCQSLALATSVRRSAMSRRLTLVVGSDHELLGAQAAGLEAVEGERGQVEGRLATGGELGQVLTDRGRLLEAVAREAGGEEEALVVPRLAHDRGVVGAHLVVTPPLRLDHAVREGREAVDRQRDELLDARLAAADDDPRPLAADVD